VELLADAGVNPVAGDQCVGGLRFEWVAVEAAEVGGDRVVALTHSRAVVPGDDDVGPQPLAHCGEEHGLEIPPVYRELRKPVTGRESGWLPVDQLAEPVEEGGLLGCDAGRAKWLEQTLLGEYADRVRQDVDAHPHRCDLRCGLVDLAVDAGGVQLEGER
jgi:hypothetical protein